MLFFVYSSNVLGIAFFFVGVLYLEFDHHFSGPRTEWKFGKWTFQVYI